MNSDESAVKKEDIIKEDPLLDIQKEIAVKLEEEDIETVVNSLAKTINQDPLEDSGKQEEIKIESDDV